MRGSSLLIVGLAAFALSAAGTAAAPISYLALRAGECALVAKPGAKAATVVPCSDPRHDLEVYAVKHGGWGHGALPSSGMLEARAQYLCLTSFVDITGRQLPGGYGWRAFWPDRGAEQQRYGDEVICSLTRASGLRPLGTGSHLQARTG
jgi:hypothetical protein